MAVSISWGGPFCRCPSKSLPGPSTVVACCFGMGFGLRIVFQALKKELHCKVQVGKGAKASQQGLFGTIRACWGLLGLIGTCPAGSDREGSLPSIAAVRSLSRERDTN